MRRGPLGPLSAPASEFLSRCFNEIPLTSLDRPLPILSTLFNNDGDGRDLVIAVDTFQDHITNAIAAELDSLLPYTTFFHLYSFCRGKRPRPYDQRPSHWRPWEFHPLWTGNSTIIAPVFPVFQSGLENDATLCLEARSFSCSPLRGPGSQASYSSYAFQKDVSSCVQTWLRLPPRPFCGVRNPMQCEGIDPWRDHDITVKTHRDEDRTSCICYGMFCYRTWR